MSSHTANTLRAHLEKMHLLIIDEISMVGVDVLYYTHRRLEDIAAHHRSDTCFGSLTILAVGDLHQLQPAGQSHVFADPSDSLGRLHDSLWVENFKMIELTEGMRQREDKKFFELLERIRIDITK